jgi:hypothetical protein
MSALNLRRKAGEAAHFVSDFLCPLRVSATRKYLGYGRVKYKRWNRANILQSANGLKLYEHPKRDRGVQSMAHLVSKS